MDVYQVVVPAGYDTNHDFDSVGDALIYATALDDVLLAKFLLDNGATGRPPFPCGPILSAYGSCERGGDGDGRFTHRKGGSE